MRRAEYKVRVALESTRDEHDVCVSLLKDHSRLLALRDEPDAAHEHVRIRLLDRGLQVPIDHSSCIRRLRTRIALGAYASGGSCIKSPLNAPYNLL